MTNNNSPWENQNSSPPAETEETETTENSQQTPDVNDEETTETVHVDTEENEDKVPIKEENEKSAKARKARQRERRNMILTTRIGEVVRIFSVTVLIFGVSIFLLVGNRPTESAEENRMLAEFPEFSAEALLDGSYIEDVMYYYEDTVPGRSVFKQLISDIETFKGLQTDDDVTFYGDISQIVQETEEETTEETTTEEATTEEASAQNGTTATTAVTTTVTTTTTEEEDLVEVGDGIVIVGTRAINVYGGSYTRGEAYAASLNSFHEDLGDDVQIYSLVAPTAVSFYLPDEYASYTASETDNIEHINENLDDDIIVVDAYSALEEHVDEDIYARTDHHWTPLGAFYATEAFADAADVPYARLSSYTEVVMEGYVGSMYTYTKSSILTDNPEDFIYYEPNNDYTTWYYDTDYTNKREGNLLISLDNIDPVSWYLVFMGSDERIVHVETDVDNDRTLVIIKDSYGNAMVPCLTHSFEDIYVIDMRYFELNAVDFIEDVGATDVLFAMNTFSATGSNTDYLEEIRTQ